MSGTITGQGMSAMITMPRLKNKFNRTDSEPRNPTVTQANAATPQNYCQTRESQKNKFKPQGGDF